MSDRERENLIEILNKYHEEHNNQHIEFIERLSDVDSKIEKMIDWQLNSTPSIEIMKQIEGFSKGVIWVMKFIGLMAVAVGAIYAFIRYLKIK